MVRRRARAAGRPGCTERPAARASNIASPGTGSKLAQLPDAHRRSDSPNCRSFRPQTGTADSPTSAPIQGLAPFHDRHASLRGVAGPRRRAWLSAGLDRLDALLDAAGGHLQRETGFVRPAVEATHRRFSDRIAGDHRKHLDAIACCIWRPLFPAPSPSRRRLTDSIGTLAGLVEA